MTTTDVGAHDILEVVGGVAPVRPGRVDDALDGVRPAAVARPAETAEVAAVVRVAAEHGWSVVPHGSGARREWGGRPSRFDILLDLGGLDAVVEHAAGDLIAVVGAGCRLETLNAELARQGQRLALDPARAGTLGGAVATGDSGPLRHLVGPARDLVLGATFVRADGVVAKAGGRVVKNVAGYDVARLLASSFGTLAVITQLTVRLHPVPEARAWVEAEIDDRERLESVAAELVHTQLAPSGLEVATEVADGGTTHRVAVLVEGSPSGVAARAEHAAAALGSGATVTTDAPPWWGVEPSGDVLVKITHEIARIGAVAAAVENVLPPGARATWHTSAGVGVGQAALTLPDSPDPTDIVVGFVEGLRRHAPGFGGTVVVRSLPAALAGEPDRIDRWGPIGPTLPLMRAVKRRFDPDGVLSPGRFVDGI